MFLSKPIEASSHLIDQAAQSAEPFVKSTQQIANEALEALSDAMDTLRHQASPLAESADQVASLAQRGLQSVRNGSHQLRVQAEHASDGTVSYIRHEPMKSVLMAAATGAALMALINLASQSRHRG